MRYGYLLETPQWGAFYENPQDIFYKEIKIFICIAFLSGVISLLAFWHHLVLLGVLFQMKKFI